MDVKYFFNERLNFIRQFYKDASLPFLEIKSKIKSGEAPFIPTYSEDGEPAFLEEWLEADESIQVLGYACVSMLSASLQLYFKTWESELGIPAVPDHKSSFKKGWINGYRSYFLANFNISFERSGVDMLRIEEIVLARHVVQHPDDISSHTVSFTDRDLKRLKKPLFSNEVDWKMSGSFNDGEHHLFPITLHITQDSLDFALGAIEGFTDWLEDEIYTYKGWRKPN